ncbi:hypothetical protein [Streptomyces nodosus]|uniref:hypothetical protein n=1 Tax=Streptomyces nodosus TaxID=40318 RepID=UPI003811E617
MTVTTHALIPALEDARAAHAAVIDKFRADLTVTPTGPHRRTLERHLADIEEYMGRIDSHVRAVRPRRLLGDATAIVRTITSAAVRAARIPLEVGAVIAEGVLHARHPVTERRLLRNIQGEYAIAAQALAACRVGESVAALADDERGMELMASLRQRDEKLLRALETTLEQLAQALVEATAENIPTPARYLTDQGHDQRWPDDRPSAGGPVGPHPTGSGLRAAASAVWAGSMAAAQQRMDTTG